MATCCASSSARNGWVPAVQVVVARDGWVPAMLAVVARDGWVPAVLAVVARGMVGYLLC